LISTHCSTTIHAGLRNSTKLTSRWGALHEQQAIREPLACHALRVVTDAPADENMAQMIEMLQEHLKLVREGKLRSMAIVSVSGDGARSAHSGRARMATAPALSASLRSSPMTSWPPGNRSSIILSTVCLPRGMGPTGVGCHLRGYGTRSHTEPIKPYGQASVVIIPNRYGPAVGRRSPVSPYMARL
jgi:hypothetical protein